MPTPGHSKATLSITPAGSVGRVRKSTYQVTCECGAKSQVVHESRIAWDWHNMHRDQFEVGTSETSPCLTN